MKKIIGVGNALVDIMTRLDNDAFLETLGLPKGSMQLVDNKTIEEISCKISDLKKSISAGGSSANTINGLANMGVNCGFIGVVGSDEMGRYFENDMCNANINTHLISSNNKSGVAIAFVSPDSERTFATYLGAALELSANYIDENVLKQYDIIHIEGYLVQNYELIEAIMHKAKSCGLKISLDMASYNVVEDNLDFLKGLVENYIDIIFANEEEAKAFTGETPEKALDIISNYCDIAVVKIGEKGSLIKQKDNIFRVGVEKVNCIDTTGAGDLYASGFLYGLVNQYPLDECGRIGAILSGNVIEVLGSKMNTEKWQFVKSKI